MHQLVEFYTTKRTNHSIIHDDAYALRNDRKHVWLQRICISILRKLGAFATSTGTRIEHHRFDAGDFLDRLHHQQRNVFDTFAHDAHTLLMGTDEFDEMMNIRGIEQMFTFTAAAQITRYGMGRLFNIHVKVIPWMKGMLVL